MRPTSRSSIAGGPYSCRTFARSRTSAATAGVTEDGRPGLRDEDLSDDGRFLYAIDADQGQIVGWAVDDRGQLSMLGAWGGVPTTVAGLAAR